MKQIQWLFIALLALLVAASGCLGMIGDSTNPPKPPDRRKPVDGGLLADGAPSDDVKIDVAKRDAGTRSDDKVRTDATTSDQDQPKDSSTSPDGSPSDTSSPPDISVLSKQCVGPAVSQVRRLTREEYKYAMLDLLGIEVNEKLLPADSSALGFASGDSISLWHIQIHMEILEKEFARVDLDALLEHCTAAQGDDSCAKKFIVSFGQKAYRRPLSTAEVDKLFQYYRAQRSTGGLNFAQAVEVLVRRILQSPFFLYRVELGVDKASASTHSLNQYEIAARLSFMLWKSIPDAALFQAAKDGKLATAQQIEQQARRMLNVKAKARRGYMSFFSQWLDLEKIYSLEKDGGVKGKKYWLFDAKVVPYLKQETERFIEHVLWQDDGKFKTLLLANYTVANGPVTRYYEYNQEWKLWKDDVWEKRVYPDATKRMGILTHASLLSIYAKSDQSSPIHRGLFVRERFLCDPPPDPPPDVNMELKPLDPNMTIRKRMEAHRSAPSCFGCHQLFDTIGFGFEHYDAIGKYQSSDNGNPVDASGSINHAGKDIDGAFTGVIELSKKLAASQTVHSCFIKKWFRYTYSRKEREGDACLLEKLKDTFKKTDGKIEELVIAMVRHQFFSHVKGSWKYTPSGSTTQPLTAGPPPPSSKGCSVRPNEGSPVSSPFSFLLYLLLVFGVSRWLVRKR